MGGGAQAIQVREGGGPELSYPNPETPNPAHPETPNPAHPETPNPAHPETPNPAHP